LRHRKICGCALGTSPIRYPILEWLVDVLKLLPGFILPSARGCRSLEQFHVYWQTVGKSNRFATGPQPLAVCLRDSTQERFVRSMVGIGLRLRTIRQQWGLSLREVEQRSRRIARERGDPSYKVSASWLNRLESDEHELTVHKLIVLAEIYSISTDQLIGSTDTAEAQSPSLDQLSSPNASILLTKGSWKKTFTLGYTIS